MGYLISRFFKSEIYVRYFLRARKKTFHKMKMGLGIRLKPRTIYLLLTPMSLRMPGFLFIYLFSVSLRHESTVKENRVI